MNDLPNDSRIATFLDMDDVPHLTDAEKRKILRGLAPYEIQARKSGIPGHGQGSIYPIAETQMTCVPFEIPGHWPRSYGMDPGWNCTAVIWFAWDIDHPYMDRDNIVRYPAVAYDEYYVGQEHPAVHAAAINLKGGKWCPGVIDPAAERARGPDGERLIEAYRALGTERLEGRQHGQVRAPDVLGRALDAEAARVHHARALDQRGEAVPARREGRDHQEERPLDGRHALQPDERVRHGEAAARERGQRHALVRVDAGDGDIGRRMVGLSVAAIDQEFKFRGQVLFVDTDGRLMVFGWESKRAGLAESLAGKEDEMKRFLTARALRDNGG